MFGRTSTHTSRLRSQETAQTIANLGLATETLTTPSWHNLRPCLDRSVKAAMGNIQDYAARKAVQSYLNSVIRFQENRLRERDAPDERLEELKRPCELALQQADKFQSTPGVQEAIMAIMTAELGGVLVL